MLYPAELRGPFVFAVCRFVAHVQVYTSLLAPAAKPKYVLMLCIHVPSAKSFQNVYALFSALSQPLPFAYFIFFSVIVL